MNLKLNYECLRELLLTLEKELIMKDDLLYPQAFLEEMSQKMPDFSKADIVYTSIMANEAGLIRAKIINADDGVCDCIYFGLSYEGHQFLDTVRDEKIWQNTKNVLSKVGSVSLDIIKSVAAFAIRDFLHL